MKVGLERRQPPVRMHVPAEGRVQRGYFCLHEYGLLYPANITFTVDYALVTLYSVSYNNKIAFTYQTSFHARHIDETFQ